VSGYFHSEPDAEVGEDPGREPRVGRVLRRRVDRHRPDQRVEHRTSHVIVAKGREYGDVPPLKGIYHGGPSSALGVVVEIVRVA
jgi:hypothetical protein